MKSTPTAETANNATEGVASKASNVASGAANVASGAGQMAYGAVTGDEASKRAGQDAVFGKSD